MRKFLLALALLAPIGCQGCVSLTVGGGIEGALGKRTAASAAAELLMLPITLPIDLAFLPLELTLLLNGVCVLPMGEINMMAH